MMAKTRNIVKNIVTIITNPPVFVKQENASRCSMIYF